MADFVPFACVRPRADMAAAVASLPYDVYSVPEAREEVARRPHAFLRIDMTETAFDEPLERHDMRLYQKARELLDADIAAGVYTSDDEPAYYLYRLTCADGRAQTGVVGCASVDDYLNEVIRKHEKTRADKELDRIYHVEACEAQTGPIFLTCRTDGRLECVMDRVCAGEALYDFVADDGVRHSVWRVESAEDTCELRALFAETESLYIADGHHRAASAVKASLRRREELAAAVTTAMSAAGVATDVVTASAATDVSAESDAAAAAAAMTAASAATDVSAASTTPATACAESAAPTTACAESGAPAACEADHFLAVVFPGNQLAVLDYNRVVADLHGLSEEEFLDAVRERFTVSDPSAAPIKPQAKGEFGMFVGGRWHALRIHDELCSPDPVDGLDVALLQDKLLSPVLGIEDPRTDKRIDFVGGIRGLEELERRVNEGMAVAFAMFPTGINELFSVADAGRLMPPKSTWFEPKLRSGLFIHRI